MSKNEAEALRDKARGYGCEASIEQLHDGSWRVYVSKCGRWTFVVDTEDLEHALEDHPLWAKGNF